VLSFELKNGKESMHKAKGKAIVLSSEYVGRGDDILGFEILDLILNNEVVNL